MALNLVTVCTGNAARSVMAGAALAQRLDDVTVHTRGTFVVEGQPMSRRTRAAIESVGLSVPQHVSRQINGSELKNADIVIALAPDHVTWIRQQFPDAAAKTGTLHRLALHWPPGRDPIEDKVGTLRLDTVELQSWEEVLDPGGHELDVFEACAREVVELVDQLIARLVP